MIKATLILLILAIAMFIIAKCEFNTMSVGEIFQAVKYDRYPVRVGLPSTLCIVFAIATAICAMITVIT